MLLCNVFTTYNIHIYIYIYRKMCIFLRQVPFSNAIVEMDRSIISIKSVNQITYILMTFYYQFEL